MKHTILFTIFYGISTLFVFAQPTQLSQLSDRLGYPLDINYSSELEKEIFLTYLDGKETDPLSRFLCLDPQVKITDVSKIKAKIEAFFQTYPKNKLQQKALKKQVGILFEGVQALFLAKYENQAEFREIFQTGTYNCLTASALYAIIFNHYDIPYSIKETPTHIYLVADPADKQFLIETTDPLTGYQNFNNQTKEAYAKFLQENRAISPEEHIQKSVKELFDEYFYSKSDISLTELAGLHYYNKGVDKMTQNEYLDALNFYEKAFVLYPSTRMEYMILASIALSIDGKKLPIKTEAQMLGKMYLTGLKNGKDTAKIQEYIFNKFMHYGYKLLKVDFLPDQYDTVYAHFTHYIPHSPVINQINKAYFFEKGSALAAQKKHTQAYVNLMKGFQLNPYNYNLRKILFEALYESVKSGDVNHERMVDSMHQSISPQIEPLEAREILDELYHIAKANALMDLHRESSALYHMAHVLPVASDTFSILRQMIAASVNMLRNNPKPISLIAQLDQYHLDHPELLEEPTYLQFTGLIRLMLTDRLFKQNNKGKAIEFIDYFESVHENMELPHQIIPDGYLISLYWEGAAYYVRRQQYKSARVFLLRCKKYLQHPDDAPLLKEKLDMISVLQRY